MRTGWVTPRAWGILIAASLCLAVPPSALPAGEYVQQQGQAILRLEADKVDAEQVELPLSGELRMTLSVEGRAPLRVGTSEAEAQQDQIEAMLASGIWSKCRPIGGATVTDLGTDHQRWQQRYRLDPLRDGQFDWQPPPFSYTEGPEQRPYQVKWKPIAVQITTEIASPDLSELRDITPIEELPPGWSWRRPALWLGLALALLGLLLGIGQLLWRWASQRPPLPPDHWALGELQRIKSLALPSTGEVDRYHLLLSDVVRKYLELRFGLHAPQQTTVEFLAALGPASPLTPAQQALLREFLQRCDLAKFARAQPSQEECQAVAAMARSFVEQTTPEVH